MIYAPTPNTIDDAICVLNAAASKQTFVMGTSEGGATSVLLASTYPERVQGLILYSSTPKLVKTNGEPDWADDEESFDAMIEQIQKQWGGAWAIQNFAPARAQDEKFRAWWAKVLRSSSSPTAVSAQLRVLRDIDIRALLPQIRTRTLVMHKTHDRILNIEAGRYFATHMPNAEWLELNGADHFFFVDSSQIVSAVKKFVEEKPNQPTDSWIGIILYAEIPQVKKYEARVLAELSHHHAKSMSFSGAELTASFDSPNRAIQCALKLRALIQNESFKIGLHVGECDLQNGKPSTSVVEVARRLADSVPQGKIILTQTLRDILAGSGVVFDLRQIYIDEKKPENLAVYLLA